MDEENNGGICSVGYFAFYNVFTAIGGSIMTKKNERILKLTEKLTSEIEELKDIDAKQLTLSAERARAVKRMNSLNQEIALLSDFDEDLKYNK